MLPSSANIWFTATLSEKEKQKHTGHTGVLWVRHISLTPRNLLVVINLPCVCLCWAHMSNWWCFLTLSPHCVYLCLSFFLSFVCSLRLQCTEWHLLLVLFVSLKIFSKGKPILILPLPHPPGVHIICRRSQWTAQIVMHLFFIHVEKQVHDSLYAKTSVVSDYYICLKAACCVCTWAQICSRLLTLTQ